MEYMWGHIAPVMTVLWIIATVTHIVMEFCTETQKSQKIHICYEIVYDRAYIVIYIETKVKGKFGLQICIM